ncbi:MAG: hypothetical protein Ct9H90mP20_3650 [Candidatus Neomarinimicrobiota bacterium]|nr:MAG: hypothetical protein Ct9H90mP20_3650 [Candidatus Neomarinimicrobiota bacterium]
MESFFDIALRRLSKLIVISTLFLIFVGALIKSHEVGLSVPGLADIIRKANVFLSYFRYGGGIFYEHGHRLFATVLVF